MGAKGHGKRKFFVSLVLTSAIIISGRLNLSAVYDEARARRQDADKIENSTLVIGTHLIHLSALNQELLAIAERSAISAPQNKRYYKSEMAEGTWFDITDANSIGDISTDGKPVPNSVINDLPFTHHTKSDGITYRLDTGQEISVFDINDPYGPNEMPELEPLKLHLEFVKEKEGSAEIGKSKMAYMNTVLKADLKTGRTKEIDEVMAKLQAYLSVLKENSAPAENISAVSGLMAQMDSERRAIVLAALADKLESLSAKIMSELPEKEQGKMSDLLTPASDSRQNVETSLNEHMGKMLQDGINIASKEKYRLSLELIDAAQAGDYTGCDKSVQDIINLDNITAGKVINKTSELDYIEKSLEPKGIDGFLSAVSKGQSSDYKAAASNKSARVLLDKIKSDDAAQVSSVRTELESFVGGKAERLPPGEAKTYIKSKIKEANTFYQKVVPDDFEQVCRAEIDGYIEFLQRTLKGILSKLTPSEADKLDTEINKTKDKMLAALDKNNLLLAQQFEEEINALNEQKNAVSGSGQKELAKNREELKDLKKKLDGAMSSTEKDLIELLSGDKTAQVSDILAKLKDELYKITKAGGISDGELKSKIAVLEPFAGKTAMEALEKLNNSGTQMDDDELNELAQQISELQQKIAANELSQGADGISGAVNELRQSSLSKINAKGDKQTLKADIDNLIKLLKENSGLVFPAIKELNLAMIKQRDINGDTSFEDEIKRLENIITENKAAYDAAMSGDIDLDKISGLTDEFFEGLLEREGNLRLNPNDKLIIELLALHMAYGDTGDDLLDNLITTKAQAGMENKNPLVFYRLKNASGQYAQICAAAYKIDFRYIWRSGKRTAILANGAKFYEFTAGSDTVKKESTTDKMYAKAEMQNDIYITESYITEQFGLFARDLAKTDFAVLYDEKILNYSEELYEIIKV